jgi:hypothetical protein
MNFWKYAPAAALTSDGSCEVSSVDQFTYLVRLNGRVFFVSCEHYANESGPAVCFYLDLPIKKLSSAGEEQTTPDEILILREALAKAVPLFGRRAEFD